MCRDSFFEKGNGPNNETISAVLLAPKKTLHGIRGERFPKEALKPSKLYQHIGAKRLTLILAKTSHGSFFGRN